MFWNETVMGALPCAALLDEGPFFERPGDRVNVRGAREVPTVIVLVAPQQRPREPREPEDVRRRDGARIDLGSRVVDLDRCRVAGPDGEETLTAREIELLRILVGRRGKVVTREELVAGVWGPDAGTSSSALDVTVYRLRRKIEEDPSDPSWLVAIRGVGYILEGTGVAAAEGGEVGADDAAPRRALPMVPNGLA